MTKSEGKLPSDILRTGCWGEVYQISVSGERWEEDFDSQITSPVRFKFFAKHLHRLNLIDAS